MRPDVKFGLIGGIIFTLVVFASTYFIEFSFRSNTIIVYLRLLVFLVSIVASIKGMRDLDRTKPMELKQGLKAGLTTVLIISAFYFAFCFIDARFKSEEKLTADNELVWTAFLERDPAKDTTTAEFNKLMTRYDSAMKVKDIRVASMSVRKAKSIRPADTTLDAKISALNHEVYLKSKETGLLFQSILFGTIFPLFVMGFFTTFFTALVFRFKQQSEM
jgi:hypothetical protein